MKKTTLIERANPSKKKHVRPATPEQVREKPEHGTSPLTAYKDIRDLIVRGKISPGSWVVEADLSVRLNMSRTPVRAAIHWLQREGYVLEQRSVSKSRMIVAPLTKQDANELYIIIGRLEGIAGRGAAELSDSNRAALVRELRTINQNLDDIASGRSKQSGDLFEWDCRFHYAIVNAGAGVRLAALHNATVPQAERYWRLYAGSVIADLRASVNEHNEIIDALDRGDVDKVEIGLQNNWLRGAERLGRIIDIFGERGSW